MWIRRKVQNGQRLGRKLGYPTLNFRVGNFAEGRQPGVYSSQVRIKNEVYRGALYFGPKFGHRGNVLEVFVIGYSGDLYGHYVSFKLGKKVRGPMKFSSPEALKKQIQKDLSHIV